MATKAQAEAALDTLVEDAAIFRAIVQGAAGDPDVITEGGAVPTVANKIASLGIPNFATQAAAITAFAAIGKVFLNDATGDVEVTPAASV